MSLVFRQHSLFFFWCWPSRGKLLSATAWFWSPLVSRQCSASRFTREPLRFYSVLWRATLLALGIALGTVNFIADIHYTAGMDRVDYRQLVTAVKWFPLDHYYRRGPAELAIHDNIWEQPKQALIVLRAVQYDDPYSRFIGKWIEIMKQRAK